MIRASQVNVTRPSDGRTFLKTGDNPLKRYGYQGCTQTGDTEKPLGESTPVYCPSTVRRGDFDIIDSIPGAPELGTFDLTLPMDRYLQDSVWDLIENGCEFNLATTLGRCQIPDNFNDWDSVLIRAGCRATSVTIPTLNPQSGEGNTAAANLTLPVQFKKLIRIKKLTFGRKADSTIVAEVLDGFYHDAISCGECGVASDGCRKYYWLTVSNSGSPGLSSQLVVSVDNKATHFALDIVPLGGLSANRLSPVGLYTVVISQAYGGHVYALFNDIDVQINNWTGVTSGYVAGKAPRAIYNKNATATFLAGAGGYVYLMTDPTQPVTVLSDGSATTQDMNDIHGIGNVVVAVGGNNAVQYSTNEGETWSALTGPAVAVNLTSVEVMSEQIWFIGTGAGEVWCTVDQGASWTRLFTGALIIDDIRFYDENVGYFVAEVNEAARGAVYWTIDGGSTWVRAGSRKTSRLQGVPTANRYNVVVPCGHNEVAIAGRVTIGGDGILAVAS